MSVRSRNRCHDIRHAHSVADDPDRHAWAPKRSRVPIGRSHEQLQTVGRAEHVLDPVERQPGIDLGPGQLHATDRVDQLTDIRPHRWLHRDQLGRFGQPSEPAVPDGNELWTIGPDTNPGPLQRLDPGGRTALGLGHRSRRRHGGSWIPYAQVEDLDVAVDKATSLGATVIAGKTNRPAGTAVTIADPGGAVVALWRPFAGKT
jgi:hypothetical protein